MEYSVSITPEFSAIFEYQYFARALSEMLNDIADSGYIGKLSRFERNSQAVASQVYKYHIRLPDVDSPWTTNSEIYRRTSDAFLVVTTHCFYAEYAQVLYILSPPAHAKVDSILPGFIDKAEAFHSLNKPALKKLQHW
uniref:type II toxin-antitoxin system YafO family toxin n=1 Tax=Salmonella enterica TaxID=28901 RepID=UPI003A95C44E